MQNDKSFVIWNDTNKQVILTCNDKLWKYLQSLRNKKVDDFDILMIAKLWKELKTLEINLEKDGN